MSLIDRIVRKCSAINKKSAKSTHTLTPSAREGESKLDSCVSTQNSSDSWCEKSDSRLQSRATADFLLESDKRGSPPKSEKAAAFWEHNLNEVGGSGCGVQPFLREDSSESNGQSGKYTKRQSRISFDKYDFYFLIVLLSSLFALIYLISGASISYKEALLLEQDKALIARLANLSIAQFGANDFALKIPNLLFHALNLVLIYLISNRLLKYKGDSVLCVVIYAIVPGVIMQGSILNESIIMLFIVLLVCYIELISKKITYPFLALAVFVDESAFMLFLALFFYALFKENNERRFIARIYANLRVNLKILVFAVICFALNLYLFGVDISGRPRGNFLDIFSEFALLYSPLLFVYFIYTIYRNFAKYKANLLLFVSGTSIIVSIILSVRQDIDKEIFMFMSLCGIPLMIRQLLSDIRLRLPQFQLNYKRRFIIVIAVLVLEAGLLIFSKQIYRLSNDDEIFLNQFYIAKEVAYELKKRDISRVSVEGRMQKRLAFYGIKDGGQNLRKVKKGGNIFVKYNGKIVVRYAI